MTRSAFQRQRQKSFVMNIADENSKQLEIGRYQENTVSKRTHANGSFSQCGFVHADSIDCGKHFERTHTSFT